MMFNIMERDFSKQAIRSSLTQAQVQALVTNRVKSEESLSKKLSVRNSEKQYESVRAIKRDIVDIAGVRIALYFPSQSLQVGEM